MFANARLVVAAYPWQVTSWRSRMFQLLFSNDWDALAAVDVNSVLSNVLGIPDVSNVIPNSPSKRPLILPCCPYPALCSDPWSIFMQMLLLCCDDDGNIRHLIESGQTGPAYPIANNNGNGIGDGGGGMAALSTPVQWDGSNSVSSSQSEDASSWLCNDKDDVDYTRCHLHAVTITRVCILLNVVQAVVDYVVSHPGMYYSNI